jgi:hypothetical protein
MFVVAELVAVDVVFEVPVAAVAAGSGEPAIELVFMLTAILPPAA